MKIMLSSIMVGFAVLGYSTSYAAEINMKKVPAKDFTALAIYLHDNPYNVMVLTNAQVEEIGNHREKFDKTYHDLYGEKLGNITNFDLEQAVKRLEK